MSASRTPRPTGRNIAAKQTFGQLPPSKWPGERLGLPNEGAHSVARAGRRIGGIAVDWAIAMGLALLLAPYESLAYSFYTLGLFAVLQVLAIAALGASIGHRVFGMRLIGLDGHSPAFWRVLVRTLLLVVVIPALVWDSDQRGFHDKVAGTVLIRA
ncbi:RDD family protein [Microterricola viridarii]|uniref:RDD family protein n=1 Tax=Microterricola viridarii TaxID=412690 RepID=A0A1H1V045_9MICO|nr:RDD family protein [Microterricola viridarii]SDS77881.1 RDD family protein [Microterricola viridarii]